ncbi:uncharacterized protein BXZ73DRAFT_105912 [Epithele typhae]|uniref:uncharacterized protein n=1 Tax=Epithele typhae TaxID=378194 RepID=UPI002007E0D8|nr:uncharacterized protein BXZ73DRAFT_105912 [Epithele typhae]KAH9916285.1 hypothetical protein BXZ73DRAFT_105912 [Epithele typhae]
MSSQSTAANTNTNSSSDVPVLYVLTPDTASSVQRARHDLLWKMGIQLDAADVDLINGGESMHATTPSSLPTVPLANGKDPGQMVAQRRHRDNSDGLAYNHPYNGLESAETRWTEGTYANSKEHYAVRDTSGFVAGIASELVINLARWSGRGRLCHTFAACRPLTGTPDPRSSVFFPKLYVSQEGRQGPPTASSPATAWMGKIKKFEIVKRLAFPASPDAPSQILGTVPFPKTTTPSYSIRERQSPGFPILSSPPFAPSLRRVAPDYYVDREEDLHTCDVRYTFLSSTGEEVEVVGPAVPFLAALNPEPTGSVRDRMEGLLYALPEPKERYSMTALFGQDFFHTMFAEFSCPGEDEPPFMRFAGRRLGPEDGQFMLPPYWR